MVKDIKGVMASQHSDGSKGGHDMPPTPEDERMTVDHTSDSIIYNTPHAVDHLEEAISKAERLKKLEPQKAKKLVKDVLKKIKPLVKDLESI